MSKSLEAFAQSEISELITNLSTIWNSVHDVHIADVEVAFRLSFQEFCASRLQLAMEEQRFKELEILNDVENINITCNQIGIAVIKEQSRRKLKAESTITKLRQAYRLLGRQIILPNTDNDLSDGFIACLDEQVDEVVIQVNSQCLDMALLIYDCQFLMNEMKIEPSTNLDSLICVSLKSNLNCKRNCLKSLCSRQIDQTQPNADEIEDFEEISTISTLSSRSSVVFKEIDLYHGERPSDALTKHNNIIIDTIIEQPNESQELTSSKPELVMLDQVDGVCTGINDDMFEAVKQRLLSLLQEKQVRIDALKSMDDEIVKLWDQLAVSESERIVFQSRIDGLSLATLDLGQDEIARLKRERGLKLKEIIEHCRGWISDMWTELCLWTRTDLMVTNLDCSIEAFYNQYYCHDLSETCTEELLAYHDAERNRLTVMHNSMIEIKRHIRIRESTLIDRMTIETLPPDRLMDRRGSSAASLKSESAMRKRIQFLPSLNKTIATEINDWERQAGRWFMVEGERYVEKMARDEDDWRSFKEGQKIDREKRKEDSEKHRRFDNNLSQSLKAKR